MNIHQVSVSYVQEQDRLLIRINGKEGGELRGWLTRRLALALLPVLNKTVTKQMNKIVGPVAPVAGLNEQRGQLLTAFQKEASLRSGDFKTSYRDQQGPPNGLLPDAEPLLLTEVKVTLLDSGQLRLQMFEKLPRQEVTRYFQVMMDPQLSNGLLHLLHQSVRASKWLQVPLPPADLQPTISLEAADLAIDLARPRYLN